MNRIESVNVVGLGYIGLPTAAILATKGGLRVHGTDLNPATVAAVSAGEVPFVEPDLAGYVKSAVDDGLLTASADVVPSDAFVIAVPTPFVGNHAPDLSFVESATRSIARVVSEGDLVVLESTSPPRTTEMIGEWLAQERPDLVVDGQLSVHLVHCPERVLPGRIMTELVTNDRIVGGVTPEAAELARTLYATFCDGEILLTDATTAELAKLVENSYRDVNIAFANELSLISDELGVNVWELIRLANHHPRVNILHPGPGVGGHCIAVDPWFIVDAAPTLTPLIRTAREVNDGKPQWVIGKVREAVKDNPEATIAALGLAFKPDIDDLRESPARRIVGDVADEFPEATVLAVEPNIDELPKELANRRNVRLAAFEDAIDAADIVLMLVDHRQFKAANAAALGLERKVLVDTRGVWR